MVKRTKRALLTLTAAMSTILVMSVNTMAAEGEDPSITAAGISSIRKVDVNIGPDFTNNKKQSSNDYEIDKQEVNSVTDTDDSSNKSETGSIDSSHNNANDQISVIPMYRLYNPNSGEHFYTASVNEKNYLVKIGWNDEGIGWYAPNSRNGIPVYRLYNKNGGEHHYTVSITERNQLIQLGWKNEGTGWYSYENTANNKRAPKAGAVSLYRQYNPNAFANNHNYTTSIEENNYLVKIGWRAEGIGWYGVHAASAGGTQKTGKTSAYNGFHLISPDTYNDPKEYDVDGTGKKDKIGWSEDNVAIYITVNGKKKSIYKSYGEQGSSDDILIYAADLNSNDEYKNLVIQTKDNGVYMHTFCAYNNDGIEVMRTLNDNFSLSDAIQNGRPVSKMTADGKGYVTIEGEDLSSQRYYLNGKDLYSA